MISSNIDKRITVLIPTLLRPTLIDAIESVPSNVQICISVDPSSKIDSELLRKISTYRNVRLWWSYKSGQGYIKNDLASTVSKGHFIILDDDDKFINGAFDKFYEILESVNPDWISFHGGNRDDLGPGTARNIPATYISKYLFDYDKYDEDNYWKSVYPSSEMLISAKLYKNLRKITGGYNYGYADDAIFSSYVMYHYRGVDIQANLTKVGSTPNGVSRSVPTMKDLDKVLTKITRLILSSDKQESRYWMKIHNNILKRVHHVISAFQK